MASSRKTQILDALVTLLRTITVANAYERNVRTVHRSAAGLPAMATTDAICIVYVDQIKLTKLEPVTPVTMTVHLLAVVRERQDLEQAVDALEADIEKAIGTDPQLGGLALDTKVVAAHECVSEELEGLGGSEMEIEIKYRHAIGNPYAAI